MTRPPRGEEALQRAIAEACLGASAGEAMERDLRGYLAGHGVAEEDIAAILAAPPRLAVYRSLVRNGLSEVVLRMLPRTRARMNAACAGRFDRDLAEFVGTVGPRTHYLRDFPAELFAWAEPRWRADASVPAYLPDLAAYELTAFAVGAATAAKAPAQIAEVTLDRPLAFAESARLVRYAHAVHELPDDDSTLPEPRATHLLAYRDASHEVRWLALTPLAAAIVAKLVDGEALGAAVQGACAQHGLAPAPVLGEIAKLLADLGERGVLLGARG